MCGQDISKSLYFVNDSICLWHLSSVCPSRLGGLRDFGNLIMDLFWIKERMVGVCGGSRCWNSLSTLNMKVKPKYSEF